MGQKEINSRIKELREDIITEIVRLMEGRGLDELELPTLEEAGDAVWIHQLTDCDYDAQDSRLLAKVLGLVESALD